MMAIYAQVKDGRVINIAVWDGKTLWQQPDNVTVILIPEDVTMDIGYSYDITSGEFIPPAITVATLDS